MVECLAQGHKHHGRGRDSNPRSDDSAIRTQIRCTKPLGHGSPMVRMVRMVMIVMVTVLVLVMVMDDDDDDDDGGGDGGDGDGDGV